MTTNGREETRSDSNMGQEIPASLINRTNAPVLAHLRDLSAHSDIAEVLITAVNGLGDVQIFCPDSAAYRYVVVSTQGIVFGFCVGMSTIAFRLDERMKQRALVTGAMPYPDCGHDWVCVTPHGGDDWPKVDVPFWALKAYVHARETRPKA